MAYLFGKDFTFTFYPIDADGNVVAPSADNPSIYLFEDKPTRDEAAAGTGADQTISSWANVGNGYQFSVSAISDPDTSSQVHIRTYWLGINFTVKASAQVQTRIISFEVSRPFGVGEELNIGVSDLSNLFPDVDQYFSEVNQSNFISEAISFVKDTLSNRGYQYWMQLQPSRLREVVLERTLYRMALALMSDGNTSFETLLTESKENYREALGGLVMSLDTDADGEEDNREQVLSYMVIL